MADRMERALRALQERVATDPVEPFIDLDGRLHASGHVVRVLEETATRFQIDEAELEWAMVEGSYCVGYAA